MDVVLLIIMFIGLTYSSMSSASSVLTHPEYVVIDEARHQWINARNGRTGLLEVSGALFTSPCTLLNNEILLPFSINRHFTLEDRRYPLKLKLVGCGDGTVFSSPITATIDSKMVSQSQLLSVTGRETGVGPMQAILIGGDNYLTYYLSRYQQNENRSSSSITMALKLTYQ